MTNHYAPPKSDIDDVNRSNSAGVTNIMIDAMRGTKPWVLLIGIVLLVSASFMVLGSVGVFVASTVGLKTKAAMPGMFVGIGAMYAILSVIYIFMAVYLIKYHSAISRLLHTVSVVDMEEALVSQRKFWRLAGVITAVMLVVMVVGIVAAIAIPILTR